MNCGDVASVASCREPNDSNELERPQEEYQQSSSFYFATCACPFVRPPARASAQHRYECREKYNPGFLLRLQTLPSKYVSLQTLLTTYTYYLSLQSVSELSCLKTRLQDTISKLGEERCSQFTRAALGKIQRIRL